MKDYFNSPLSRNELSDILYEMLITAGVDRGEAWEKVDKLGRAALVREIEDLEAAGVL